MAARTRIGIGAGNTVEIPWEGQRIIGIGECCARSLRERSSSTLLAGPHGREQLSPVRDQMPRSGLKFLAVFQVDRNCNFLPDFGFCGLSRQNTGRNKKYAENYP